MLFQKPLDYTLLKTFGYECWPYLRPYNSQKFSFCSTPCIFLGYNKPHSGYKCLDITSGGIYIARYVIFNEIIFPFKTLSHSAGPVTPTSTHVLPNLSTFSILSTAHATCPPAFVPSALSRPPRPTATDSSQSSSEYFTSCF
jgi:hypothetical protein